MLIGFCSTQQNVTFTKKMIEDNSTMDETVQFLCVSATTALSHMTPVWVLFQFVCWEHWQFSMIVLNDLLLEVCHVACRCIHYICARRLQQYKYLI